MIDSNFLIVYTEKYVLKMYIKEDARKRRELNVNFSIICRPRVLSIVKEAWLIKRNPEERVLHRYTNI